jgi:hypothetical protein
MSDRDHGAVVPDGGSRSLPRFGARFLRVWGVAVVGVASLALERPPAALLERAPELATVPKETLRWLLLVNPLLLATIGALLGAAFAHRVQLGSRIAGTWPANVGRSDARWWARAGAAGLVVAATLGLLDWALRPVVGEALMRSLGTPSGATSTLIAILYGGIAEEVRRGRAPRRRRAGRPRPRWPGAPSWSRRWCSPRATCRRWPRWSSRRPRWSRARWP